MKVEPGPAEVEKIILALSDTVIQQTKFLVVIIIITDEQIKSGVHVDLVTYRP